MAAPRSLGKVPAYAGDQTRCVDNILKTQGTESTSSLRPEDGDALGLGPEGTVRVDMEERTDVTADAVERAGTKLNGLTPTCPMLPATPALPSLKDLPKGLLGAVGGMLVGGGAMGSVMAVDEGLDPPSKVLLSLATAIASGVGGFLIEQARRSYI